MILFIYIPKYDSYDGITAVECNDGVPPSEIYVPATSNTRNIQRQRRRDAVVT
ncbi:MAG: hypothetical protein IKZ46_04200 [Victivallales bacterium]|nr:hypothetical protein [Victivallales bacterium]